MLPHNHRNDIHPMNLCISLCYASSPLSYYGGTLCIVCRLDIQKSIEFIESYTQAAAEKVVAFLSDFAKSLTSDRSSGEKRQDDSSQTLYSQKWQKAF